MQWLCRLLNSFLIVTLLVTPQVGSKLTPKNCLAPASTVAKQPASHALFLPFNADSVFIPKDFFVELAQTKRKLLQRSEGEEKALAFIKKQENFYLIYLDVNNLKLRNWIYTREMMDVVLADFDNILMGLAQQEQGFAYMQGGDERVVVLPTKDPAVAQKFLFKIQTYLRREMKKKYKVAVPQLDGDSRIVTQSKENKKDDATRKILFQGKYNEHGPTDKDRQGILSLLEEEGVKWVRHSEQYFLIYENEDKLDEVFFRIQKKYPRHLIDFKPHAYNSGVLDTPVVTAVGSSLNETLEDMDPKLNKTAKNILEQWVLRNEIASQELAEKGKDAVALLHPQATPLKENSARSEGKISVLINEDEIEQERKERPRIHPWFSGQEDGLFFRLPRMEVAIKNLAAVRTSGYLVKVDIGYLNDVIKRELLKFERSEKEIIEKKLRQTNPNLDLNEESVKQDIHQKIQEELFQQYRVISPHIMGVNTKFLNQVFKHGGTDDLISAILMFVWRQTNQVTSEQWNPPLFLFRGPPDSIYLWFPVLSNGLNEREEIPKLKAVVQGIFSGVRENIFWATDLSSQPNGFDKRINLNFLISVLSVKDTDFVKLIPNGDERKANALFENMERAYRVLMESVIKEKANRFDAFWDKMGDATKKEAPEILTAIREKMVDEFKKELRLIDPHHSDVSFDSLSQDKFLLKGDFFLVYNGNIEIKSEAIQVELAVNSQVEVLRRDLLEKGEKWKQEVALAKQTGKPNYNELFYILAAMLEREKELERFNDVARRLKVDLEISVSSNDAQRLKQLAKKLKDPNSSASGDDSEILMTLKEHFDPDKIYNKLEKEREKLEEELFQLTGVSMDREKGAQFLGEKNKMLNVLLEDSKKEKWRTLRREYRQLLQFTRNKEFFKQFVLRYQKLLDSVHIMPRAEQLLKELSRTDLRLFHGLMKLILSDQPPLFSSEKHLIFLSSITLEQWERLKERFRPLAQEAQNQIETTRLSPKKETLLETAI